MTKEKNVEKLYNNQYYTIPIEPVEILEQFNRMIAEIEKEEEQDAYSMDYEIAVDDFERIFNKYLGRK